MKFRNLMSFISFLGVCALSPSLLAAGSEEISVRDSRGHLYMCLDLKTQVLYLDIEDAEKEKIFFDSSDPSLQVTLALSGNKYVLHPSDTISVSSGHVTGAWKVTFQRATSNNVTWTLKVLDESGKSIPGRLYAYRWDFTTDAGMCGDLSASNYLQKMKFYARIDSLSSSPPGPVVEFYLNGIIAGESSFFAPRTSVLGVEEARSRSGMTSRPSKLLDKRNAYPLYLQFPDKADYTEYRVNLPSLRKKYMDGSQCSYTKLGETISFSVPKKSVPKDVLLLCGISSSSSKPSYLKTLFPREVGNDFVFEWTPPDSILSGTYYCRLDSEMKKLHFVLWDVEVLTPGLRMFSVMKNAGRYEHSALPLFWDDSGVSAAFHELDNGGDVLKMPEDPNGIVSKADYSLVIPYGSSTKNAIKNSAGNARAWGSVKPLIKKNYGSSARLDTYTYLDYQPAVIPVELKAGKVVTQDIDGDGLTDYQERCIVGSDPIKSDSDGDGILDGVECQFLISPSGGSPCQDRNANGVPDWNESTEASVTHYISGGGGCSVLSRGERAPLGVFVGTLLMTLVGLVVSRRQVEI